MAKYSNDKKEIKRRAKEFDCDGICYSRDKMCPRVDYCPETRSKEFAATVIAVLFIASFYMLILALFVGFFLSLIK